ncbi:MAG: hypothetical protein ACI4RS_06060, partial [Monoglobaceae bacterium]
MKKFLCALLTVIMLTSMFAVYADEEVLPVAEEKVNALEEETSKNEKDDADKTLTYNKIYVDLKLIPRMKVIDSFAKLEICTKDDKVIEEKVEWVGGITEKLSFEFDVPEYSLGESFILKLKGG